MPVLVAVLLAAGSAAGLVTAFPATDASAASAPGPVLGSACPDVMVIAARGSAEQPQAGGPYGDPNDPAAYSVLNPYPNVEQGRDTYYGAGRFNYDVYTTLKAADSQLRVSLDPVRYPALPVPTNVTGLPAFEASAVAGADGIVTEIGRVRAACGNGNQVRFVLAGYSQGAWSVHKALYKLEAQNDGSLDLISAVVLFGDPEFEPGLTIDRGSQKGLTNFGIATPADFGRTDVPSSLRAKTADYCLPHDPVCQAISAAAVLAAVALAPLAALSPFAGLLGSAAALSPFISNYNHCKAVNWAYGKCPHTSYETSGATAEAASFVAAFLPKTVVVPADAEGGVDTGIYALKGNTIVITGSGMAGYGYEGTPPCVGYPTTDPDGNRYLGSFTCGAKDDPDAALPGAAIGLLIARIGGGAWFAVGTGTTVTADGNGYIYLAYNDTYYADNTGSYSATITKNRALAAEWSPGLADDPLGGGPAR